MILMRDALAHMEKRGSDGKLLPFSCEFIAYSRQRGEGGKIVTIPQASLSYDKKQYSGNKAGMGLVAAGAISMSIGFLLPDGSEWTFAKGYNSQIITKPFYRNPARVTCIGIGLTLSIGGLIYNKNHR